MWGLWKGVSGKPYPRLCNARRPRLEPGTFRSQAVRLYRLHQARPSKLCKKKILNDNLKNEDPGRLVANKSGIFLILQNIVKDIDESKKYAMVFN